MFINFAKNQTDGEDEDALHLTSLEEERPREHRDHGVTYVRMSDYVPGQVDV